MCSYCSNETVFRVRECCGSSVCDSCKENDDLIHEGGCLLYDPMDWEYPEGFMRPGEPITYSYDDDGYLVSNNRPVWSGAFGYVDEFDEWHYTGFDNDTAYFRSKNKWQ